MYQVGNNKKVLLWCTANKVSRFPPWIPPLLHSIQFFFIPHTIGPTDLIHHSLEIHYKTFHAFLIYFPKYPTAVPYTAMHQMKRFTNFHSCTVHFDVIKSFIFPPNAQLICFKILKFSLRFTINAATCFGLTKPSSGSIQCVLR